MTETVPRLMLNLATKCKPERHAFERAWQAGFRCAELWLNDQLLDEAERIIAEGRDFDLRYVPHFPKSVGAPQTQLAGAVRLYRALDCRAMVIHRPMYEQFGARLLEREPALVLAVENHRLSPAELDDWLDRNEYLTLDIEHLWKFTFPDASLPAILDRLRATVERAGAKLRHVHLPGYVPGHPEHRPMYCSRELVMGAFSILREASYRGLIVSEVNAEFQNEHELRMDVLLFQRWRQQQLAGETA